MILLRSVPWPAVAVVLLRVGKLCVRVFEIMITSCSAACDILPLLRTFYVLRTVTVYCCETLWRELLIMLKMEGNNAATLILDDLYTPPTHYWHGYCGTN